MKYKVGDEVVLKNGKKVEVEIVEEDSFYVVGKKGDFFLTKVLEDNIDHEKTATLNHYENELEKVVAEKNQLDKMRSSRIINVVPATNIQRHKELTDFMHQTYIEKNKDYGDSFGQTHKKYGALAGLTRIADKFHRLENIILNDTTIQVDDESVIDTLVDMSNYLLMLAMELEDDFKNDSLPDKK